MTESFAQLFEQSIASQRIKPGTILMGHVVEVGQDFVIVSVGLKSEAVISIDQFRSEKGEIEVKAGDDVEVALDTVEDGSGETRLSREKAKRARTWTRLEKAFEASEIVKEFQAEGKVRLHHADYRGEAVIPPFGGDASADAVLRCRIQPHRTDDAAFPR